MAKGTDENPHRALSGGPNHTAVGSLLLDPKVFDKVVEQHDWQNFILTTPHSAIYADFVALFNQFKQLATRVVTIRQSNSHNTWMTREILAAIKKKDILWAQSKRAPNCVELRSKFRQSRNRVNAWLNENTLERDFGTPVQTAERPGRC